MPFEVKVSAACPVNSKYGVWKDGQLLGCHSSEDNASKQIEAIYASEAVERVKYDGIDFSPPEGARVEAQKGLDWRKKFGRGGTPVGWARARDIANGEDLSPETIRRMNSYFARHEVDKKGEGWSPGEKGFPSAGRIAWALWGGDAGRAWAGKVQRQMESRKRSQRLSSVQTIQRKFGRIKDGKAVIATETPVLIYDEARRQHIQQVLLMEGVKFRQDRKQLPIVDSHNDKTVRNVFGSIRDIVIEGDQLVGSPEFASDEESQKIATRYNEGHLNDFSIDAQILERKYVPEGSQYITRQGNVIEGPAEIVTAWEPHNASICATGADPNSTVRRSYDQGEETMEAETLERLKRLGMPEGMTEADEIIRWLATRMEDVKPEDKVEKMEHKKLEDEVKKTQDVPPDDKVENMKDKVEEEVARQIKAEKIRRDAIVASVKLARLERSYADDLIDSGCSVADANERILQKMAKEPIGTGAVQGSSFNVTDSEHDKFMEQATAGLVQRCFQGQIKNQQAPQVAGSEHFRNLGLYRLAEACVRRMRLNPERFSKADVARVAMGHQGTWDRLRIQRSNDVYHTSGSFANILLDSASKTLLASYVEAPYTWNQWVRQAQSVDDFKNINRISLGESPNLEIIPEGKEYPEGKVVDQKKTYNMQKYGKEFTITWETVINDDLDAISRIPAMHGAAARRTQEQHIYDVFLANPTMPDGVALFSDSHTSGTNLSDGAGAPSEATLNKAFEVMGKQKGLSSDVFLGLNPSILLVPLAYAGTALQLVNSTASVESEKNEGVANLYGRGGARQLKVVSSPYLDANSATNWYAIADNSLIDTVEITFLSGEESPVLESDWNMRNDSYIYKVRQSFAAAVIDHRGIFANRA